MDDWFFEDGLGRKISIKMQRIVIAGDLGKSYYILLAIRKSFFKTITYLQVIHIFFFDSCLSAKPILVSAKPNQQHLNIQNFLKHVPENKIPGETQISHAS